VTRQHDRGIEASLKGASQDITKMSDADLLERCNRLLPATMQAATLADASKALTAVAAFSVFLTTEIEGRP